MASGTDNTTTQLDCDCHFCVLNGVSALIHTVNAQYGIDFLFNLLKFINQTKTIHTVNAVKQAENRLVEWPTQG